MGSAWGGECLPGGVPMRIRDRDGNDDYDALDIPTVCRRSKTGRSFVYNEIRSGRLIARKFGRLTRILRADYEAWLATASTVPTQPAGRTASPRCPEPEPETYPVFKSIGDDQSYKPNGAVNGPIGAKPIKRVGHKARPGTRHL